jgi:Galactose oxidase, central domain
MTWTWREASSAGDVPPPRSSHSVVAVQVRVIKLHIQGYMHCCMRMHIPNSASQQQHTTAARGCFVSSAGMGVPWWSPAEVDLLRMQHCGIAGHPAALHCLLPCGSVRARHSVMILEYHLVAFAVQGSIYVFGGEQVPRTPLPNDVFRYDLGSDTWHQVQVGASA